MGETKMRITIQLVVFACFWNGVLQAANPVEFDGTRVASITATLADQPKGYGPACSDRAAWSSPKVVNRLQLLIGAADKLTTQNFPAWDDNAYLEYSRQGTRGTGESMMNARKAWLYPLVLAECATGNGKYLPAIEQTLNELDDQPSWTFPTHDKGLRNLKRKDYEVDLVAADLGHDIAQTLYMLGDKLSPQVRQKSMAALEQRVFSPVRRTLLTNNRDNSWLTENNNWNAVCLKGVVAAALTVLPEKKDRAVFAAAGVQYSTYYVAGFTSDGYTPEGPSYWNYGFSHFTELRETLYSATKGKIDLFSENNKVRTMALYGYNYEMLPGVVASFGDASPRNRMDDFTRAYANQAFGLNQTQRLEELPLNASQYGTAAPLANTVLKLFATPAKPAGIPQVPLKIGLQSYFDSVGVLISRPAPGGNFAISIKAGGNGSHSHNDIGSYSIALGDEKPTGDPGGTTYSSKTFSKDRYTIRAINSWGHPVPVVDGELQLEAARVIPRVVETNFSTAEDRIVIDLAPAYKSRDLRRLTRTMRHERVGAGAIEIEDNFEFSSPKPFEVAIISSGNWQQTGEKEIELWQQKQHLIGHIEASAPFEITSEKVNEDGIAFSRIGIRLVSPQQSGVVRVRYAPKPSAQ